MLPVCYSIFEISKTEFVEFSPFWCHCWNSSWSLSRQLDKYIWWIFMSLLWGHVFELKTILLWLYITFYAYTQQIGFNQFTKFQTPVLNHNISTMKECCLPFVWQEGHQGQCEAGRLAEICFTLHWLWTPPRGVTCHSHYHTVPGSCSTNTFKIQVPRGLHPCSTQQPSVTKL